MANIKFGTDGWRGILDKDFNQENFTIAVNAIGEYLYKHGKNELLIGYDPRREGDSYAGLAANILANQGINVKLSSKIVPTPILAYYAGLTSTCAIMLTASHNPPEYLGLKFIPEYAGPATDDITSEIMSYLGKQIVSTDSGKISYTEFFNESISESAFVKVAKRFYQSNDVVDIYDGSIESDSNGISGEYQEKEEFTVEQYEETWGKNLSQPVIYIISSKTTLETSSITTSDNGYTISLDLDPLTSVIRYSKQMIQMSSLSNAPEFTKVHVEFEVDKDLNLLEMNVTEAYYVWVVGKNFTEATLNEKYTILDSAPEIPTIDEKIYF